MPRKPKPPPDPLEIIARALCRADPDGETPKGPLWKMYARDAERVWGELKRHKLVSE